MFIKNKENFTCEHCGHAMVGDGYTNHCSKCLYSKHVDIDPGDRAEGCGGLMVPISAEEGGGEWTLIHKCLKCNLIRKNKIAKEDDFDRIIQLSGISLVAK